MSAKFITIEGVDGSGKSTQARMLYEALKARGERVVLTREPTDKPVGALIRATLSGGTKMPACSMPYLFAADRAMHLAEEVLPSLSEGYTVICDRYIDSSLVYQTIELSRDGMGPKEAWERIQKINAPFRRPDLTIIIKVPPEVAIQRVRDRITQGEGLPERYDETIAACAILYDRLSLRHRSSPVNGNMAPKLVAKEIMKLVTSL